MLIADVGVDGCETGQFRAGLGRDVQAALRHGCQQADRLECDGLAARVGAGDDHRERAGQRVDIGGHHRFRVQQRVAGVQQPDWRARIARGGLRTAQHRFVCPDRVRIFRLGKCQVEFGQRRHPGFNFSCQAANLRGEFGQHPAGFIPFGDHGFTQGVVEFHHRQRLDKQRRPGGGLVMHDGLDLALEFRPQRDDVAPVPLGDDAVL